MKLKVSGEWTEQNNSGNAHRKYAIREFKCHLHCAADVDFSYIIFFVLLIRWLFENKLLTKMKVKISGEWMEKITA